MYTKLQIIEQLFDNGYCKDPTTRAMLSQDKCQYITDDGRMCAVGKCMLDPVQAMEDGNNGVTYYDDRLDSLLKPEYRGHCVEYWLDLQSLHDDNLPVGPLWDGSGMTVKGYEELNRLKTKWGNS